MKDRVNYDDTQKIMLQTIDGYMNGLAKEVLGCRHHYFARLCAFADTNVCPCTTRNPVGREQPTRTQGWRVPGHSVVSHWLFSTHQVSRCIGTYVTVISDCGFTPACSIYKISHH